ncbi:MAG: type II toxin-antitoxin system RelE/ParE family toxin [Chlorobi bacterium]|nr:type II toxin-antitoxin system RelE/ParE family toxin [Chlorobiota bacterium]
MAEKEIRITYKLPAIRSIAKIGNYIADKGYPKTADNFISELYKFGNSLKNFPEKYPICRKETWAKRNLRCAVFEKNYIFIYKLVRNKLVIFNVVHVLTIS